MPKKKHIYGQKKKHWWAFFVCVNCSPLVLELLPDKFSFFAFISTKMAKHLCGCSELLFPSQILTEHNNVAEGNETLALADAVFRPQTNADWINGVSAGRSEIAHSILTLSFQKHFGATIISSQSAKSYHYAHP